MERPVGLVGELVGDVEVAVVAEADRGEEVLRLVGRDPCAVRGVRRRCRSSSRRRRRARATSNPRRRSALIRDGRRGAARATRSARPTPRPARWRPARLRRGSRPRTRPTRAWSSVSQPDRCEQQGRRQLLHRRQQHQPAAGQQARAHERGVHRERPPQRRGAEQASRLADASGHAGDGDLARAQRLRTEVDDVGRDEQRRRSGTGGRSSGTLSAQNARLSAITRPGHGEPAEHRRVGHRADPAAVPAGEQRRRAARPAIGDDGGDDTEPGRRPRRLAPGRPARRRGCRAANRTGRCRATPTGPSDTSGATSATSEHGDDGRQRRDPPPTERDRAACAAPPAAAP